MHMLSIHFGPNQVIWGLLFKDKEKAEAETAKIRMVLIGSPGVSTFSPLQCVQVEDDFGQSASISIASIHGILLEDCDLTQESTIQKALHQERTRVKAQTRARGDAVLKAAGLGQSMPSFNPQAANGRFS